MAKAKEKEISVLVTTAHRGVFYGWALESGCHGETIVLRGARNVIYWPASQKGFLGLAANGPNKECRLGPAADIELRNITCVARVSPDAASDWEKFVWN